MNQAWLYTLISVLLISLVSFVGVFTLTLKLQTLKKILLLFVSFSAGTLLGGVFFQLIPEAIETQGITSVVSFSIIFGIIFFFILEKIICWRHCHRPTTKDHPHPFAINNLIGDAFHNFIDGVIIAASYSINLPLGLITSTAVLFHEIPQEIGDFGVLIYGGFSPLKALSLNFLSAITALLGAILTLTLNAQTEIFSKVLVPFTAGSFIYIALSDLIPELHKETNIKKSLLQLACLSLGLFIMFILTFIGH